MYSLVLNFYLFFIKILRFLFRYNINQIKCFNSYSLKFHFLSLLSVYNVREMVKLGLPWWTYNSVFFLKQHLKNKTKLDAFEYGPGASSFWLKKYCKSISFVEHDKYFYDYFKNLIKNEKKINGKLVVPSPKKKAKFTSNKSGWIGFDFEQYVKSISNEGKKFDIIVIDGRSRVSAFKYSTKFLKKNGIIIFDNSKRIRYSDIFRSGMSYKKFKGYVPTLPLKDETCIFFKN